MNHSKILAGILTQTWQNELLKLPKYQRREIAKAAKIMKTVDRIKFGFITIPELRKQLAEIIKAKK